MSANTYRIRISPEVINGDVFKVNYIGDPYLEQQRIPFCCDIYTREVTKYIDGSAYVYSSMTQILTGATGTTATNNISKATLKRGTSLLTGLTIPILITENTVDVGYYSVFDGMVLQQDVMTNFLFSANTLSAYTYNFYNTSDIEFKKYLAFSSYKIDWGDGTPKQTITNFSPNFYQHTYSQASPTSGFTISMSGMSPWGSNVVKKTVTVPFTNTTILDPKGTTCFTPMGGSWSATPICYDFIYSGDASCETYQSGVNPYLTVPLVVSGYTQSTVSDLRVYGKKQDLLDGYYIQGVQITGTTGVVGTYWGGNTNGNQLYTGYTINGVDYYDFSDGTTLFVVSGVTPIDTVCEPIVKNEALLNVIDEPEVQSNVFIERGKVSGFESMERLGEVDNLGDLEKYGYKYFNIIKID
jgi:hypothetical protein